MHHLDGFDLGFTGRATRMARVFRDGRLLNGVPVTWTHRRRWDHGANQPLDLVVRFTSAKKAQAWVENKEAVLAVAEAVNPEGGSPRRFKRFVALYTVRPTEILDDDPQAVRADYIDSLTRSGQPGQPDLSGGMGAPR